MGGGESLMLTAARRPYVGLALVLSILFGACAQTPPGTVTPTGATGAAGEQPRPGGQLVFVVASEPPSFDAHKEGTYAAHHPVSPHYSPPPRYDPDELTKIIPDDPGHGLQVVAHQEAVVWRHRVDLRARALLPRGE